MRGEFNHPGRKNKKRPLKAGALFRYVRKAAPALLCFGLVFLLTSCLSALQEVSSFKPLPKVDITPPADYTKGAPFYEMFFHTNSSSIPGMAGLAGGGAGRDVSLRMVSHPGPAGGASPRAWHMIPPGMNMGEYLPLLPPEPESTRQPTSGGGTGEEKNERFVMKLYWGCDENVRKGQPRVYDSAKMKSGNMPDIGWGGGASAYAGRKGGGLKPGWAEVDWPNKEDARTVPDSASLVGEHFLHGNFLPHMRFNMDSRHDIMRKLSVAAQQESLKEAIPIAWNRLPTGIGYHVLAIGFKNSGKELIIWTSSENPNINVSGQFLDTPQVRKHISAKVILPGDRERCVIPRGIFDGADGVYVTVTAWGDDYWYSYPPKPDKAPKNWKPDWTIKGQFLSTGTLTLGMTGGGAGGPVGAPGLGDLLRGMF